MSVADMAETIAARKMQADKDDERKAYLIAFAREYDPQRIKMALDRVDFWEKQGVCSQVFVDKWRHILSLSSQEMVKAVSVPMEQWGFALRQNSPVRDW